MTNRQSPGKGYTGSYSTAAGTRWEYKATLTLNGQKKIVHKRGFDTKTKANKALHAVLAASDAGTYAEPSKQLLGDYLATWLDGLQHSPSTVASYRKNARLHISPHLGTLPLSAVTPQVLAAHYRMLETSGRRDGLGEGLGFRTVRYVATIISAALQDAVEQGLLQGNPARSKASKPPTAKQAAPPEMHPWSAAQLSAFLAWSREHSELHAAWTVLAFTGMRRGELLALRWQDVDLAAGTIAVKRSATLVRVKGEGASIVTGPVKTNKPRVVDTDPATVAVLKSWKAERGTLSLALAKPDALVFGNEENEPRHPEHFSRTWNQTVKRAIKAGADTVPARLHDLRHTHASLMLADRVPVKVVSERLGHSSPMVTLTIYAHVMPGDQSQAAKSFAALIEDAAGN